MNARESIDTTGGELTGQDVRGQLEALLARLRAAENAQQELNVLLDVWSKRRELEGLWQCSPELYQHLGRRFLKLGAAPLAREVARAGLALAVTQHSGQQPCPWARDVELRQIHGLALARTANPQRAQEILAELRDEGQADEETLGMLARTHKDLALTATDESTRSERLAASYQLYEEAYRHTGGYWTGINVVTLACLRGDYERSTEVAARVREQCLAELSRIEEQNRRQDQKQDAYWVLATLGEAALARGDVAQAEQFYTQARELARHRFGDLNSTRRHARWLLAHWRQDATLLDRWLPLPKVVVFTGHMIDQPGRPRERFPPRLAEAVKSSLGAWLHEQQALVGFSSAACGSDILFQEALHELGGETYVVLPYETESFVTDSVSIAADGDWPGRFRRVLDHATQIITASAQKMRGGAISYDYANLVLHGLATVRARQLETDLVGLAAWDGQSGNGPGGTASVVARWQALQLPVYHLNLATMCERGAAAAPAVCTLPPALVRPSPQADDETRVMALLFGDAVNFSKLTEDQVPLFVEHFLGPIGSFLDGSYAESNVVRNTWGDGLYLVFDSIRDAGCCALDICDFVNEHIRQRTWGRAGLPGDLNVRLAVHAGPVFRCHDPVTRQLNYTGTHVSRAARLEPKTPPGEVYASEAFAALAAVEKVTDFTCEYVKQLQWAKHYGTFPTYALRRCVGPAGRNR